MVEPHPTPAGTACPLGAAGDAEGRLHDLVVSHRRVLRAFILRRIGDAAESEDLTQQAFLEAMLHFDRFRGQAQLSTWLFGIALNLVRNHLARSPQRRHAHEGLEGAAELPAEHADPAEQAAQRQALRHLFDELDQLPREVRDVLLAVAVDELSYEQAAVMLSMPIGTVRSRVSRARSTLRARLAPLGLVEQV